MGNTNRRSPNFRRNTHPFREERRAGATARNKVWAGFSTEVKIAELDRRLGKGIGAVKQRKKLAV